MPNEIDGVIHYSSQEVSEECGVSRQTLWRWRKNGKIPLGRRFRDGSLLFSETERETVIDYANRVEPIEQGSVNQLSLLFNKK